MIVTHQFVSPKAEQVDPTLVGSNEWNAQHVVSGLPYLTSSDYNFTPQTPGGSLIVGSNIIIMNPVPPGVVVGSTLCISGGTGTQEAVTITGVSGSNVIVNCANTHSGAWTVSSATCGIQEAINSLPIAGYGGGKVIVPPGTWNMCGGVSINKKFVYVEGVGRVGTTLLAGFNGPLFSFPSSVDQCGISNMYLMGIGTGSTTFAITAVSLGNTSFYNLTINGFFSGISITGNAAGVFGVNLYMSTIAGDGIYINTPVAGGTWYNVVIYGDAKSTISKGLHLTQCVGLNLVNVYTNGTAYGVYIDPASGTSVAIIEAFNLYCDGFAANSYMGMRITPAGGNVNTNSFIAGGSMGFSGGPGLLFDGTGSVQDIVFSECSFTANGQAGVDIPASALTISNVTFNNCLAEANSTSSTGSFPGMLIQNGIGIKVRDGLYGGGSYDGGANTQQYGIVVNGGTQNVQILGAIVIPNLTGSITVVGSNPGLVIKDCIGYNPVGQVSITVGASPFTYTSGYSPETVYVQGGAITGVNIGSRVIANTAPPTGQSIIVTLGPNESLVVSYTALPTMFRDIQ